MGSTGSAMASSTRTFTYAAIGLGLAAAVALFSPRIGADVPSAETKDAPTERDALEIAGRPSPHREGSHPGDLPGSNLSAEGPESSKELVTEPEATRAAVDFLNDLSVLLESPDRSESDVTAFLRSRKADAHPRSERIADEETRMTWSGALPGVRGARFEVRMRTMVPGGGLQFESASVFPPRGQNASRRAVETLRRSFAEKPVSESVHEGAVVWTFADGRTTWVEADGEGTIRDSEAVRIGTERSAEGLDSETAAVPMEFQK